MDNNVKVPNQYVSTDLELYKKYASDKYRSLVDQDIQEQLIDSLAHCNYLH